jgi:hypothetical protein
MDAPFRGPVRWATAAVGLLLAASAVPVGLLLAARPDGSLVGLPLALLAGSPFADFRTPGLLLALVVGGSTAAAGVLAVRGRPAAPWVAGLAGAIVLGWIAVQLALLGYVSLLQPVVGVLGVALLALGGAGVRPEGHAGLLK